MPEFKVIENLKPNKEIDEIELKIWNRIMLFYQL